MTKTFKINWETIHSPEITEEDYFFCAFNPTPDNYFVDSDTRGNEHLMIYPTFNFSSWNQTPTQKKRTLDGWKGVYEVDVLEWYEDEANRLEILVDGSDWYAICQQGQSFFTVSNLGGHPLVLCNNFGFGNSDGSTGKVFHLKQCTDPAATLACMIDIAEEFCNEQIH